MKPHHFLKIEGASVVQTEPLRLVSRVVKDVIHRRAMGAVYGVAGLGKTFATETAAANLEIPVHWVRPLKRSTMKMVGDAILYEVTGVEHKESLPRLTRSAIRVLSETLRLIVIDEAQRLNEECIEYLRHLHDDPSTDFGLLLVGGNRCWEVISKHPMVESRCVRRVEFQPLTTNQVLTLIPLYHSLYADLDRELLLLIDDCFAHGNFRNWASFTAAASDLMAEFDLPKLNEGIARNVFGLYGGDARDARSEAA
jgi:type II secretory pathway predicted ATPase ExeA